MEKCYEFFGCEKKECVMFDPKNSKLCWESDNTLCNSEGIEYIMKKHNNNKEEVCKFCIYYKEAQKRVQD
jgi:hypothetical protein